MESNKAVIAAVNGPALGAGMGLAVCCDIILASENAVFGLPEIDIGLMGGVRHTMRLMPLSLTRKMVLSGYRVPAAELYRRGIIEECVPLEQLMPEAMKLANEIAKKSPMALKLAKRAINTVETMGLKDGYRFEQNLTVEMTQHEDCKEAMRAFIEKREPVFKDVVVMRGRTATTLPDEEFRRIVSRTWVEANCPPRLRNMRKQRPLFDEVADWYHALARKGLAGAGLAAGNTAAWACTPAQTHHLCRGVGRGSAVRAFPITASAWSGRC